ncbi:hypothetical protein J7643_11520 [bacterium]|nr:hypothetical protein [bacterium]
MTSRACALLLGLTVTLAACTSLPTTPVTARTAWAAGGLVRQFVLPAGEAMRVELGEANRLLMAVSAAHAEAPAFQFRIQHQHPTQGEARFRESGARLAQEPGALDWEPVRRVQAAAETETFWVNIGDSTEAGDRKRTAKRRLTTAHANFYVDAEGAEGITDDQLKRLGEAFESRIYGTVTGTFGAEPKTDPSGESRVYVVLSPAVDNFGKDKGLMGYFWSRDLLSPAATGPRAHTNQKKVIFLTSRLFEQPAQTVFGTLAHEFTHLCVFNQKVLVPNRATPEETWLDEGWAMLAMDLCGYGLRGGNEAIARDIKRFEEAPAEYSLTDWAGNPNGFSYGLSYLFARYLYDRFGAEVVKDALAAPATGVGAVQGGLVKREASFQDVYSDWTVANAVSGLKLTDDRRFSYASDVNLRGTYGGLTLGGVQARPVADFQKGLPGTLRPWSTTYYDLKAPAKRTWAFEFRSGSALFGGAIVLP